MKGALDDSNFMELEIDEETIKKIDKSNDPFLAWWKIINIYFIDKIYYYIWLIIIIKKIIKIFIKFKNILYN